MTDEPVPLGWLSGATTTGLLQSGQQSVHFPCVVLYQFNSIVKLGTILNGNATVWVSGDDVVILLALSTWDINDSFTEQTQKRFFSRW